MEQNIQLYGRNDMVVLQDNKIYGSLGLAEKYIVKTKQGTPPLLLDSSLKSKFLGMNIYGKSTQDGTPTPENPVEIKSIGDSGSIEALISSDNLIDYYNAVPNATGAIRYDGNRLYFQRISASVGSVAIQGGATWVVYLIKGTVHIKISKTVMLRVYKGNVFEIGYLSGNRIFNKIVYEKCDFEIPENGFYTFGLWEDNLKEENFVDYISVSYIETSGVGIYKQPQTMFISTPNGLHGIPVSSGGNYTDGKGQQWICDEIDFERGKYVKNVMCSDLKDVDWDNYWNKLFYIDGTFIVFTSHFNNAAIKRNCEIICSHFVNLGESILTSEKIQCENGQGGGFNIAFRVPSTLANSVEEWKQWISDNNVQLLFPLKTPIETDLTTEEIDWYKALHSNYPNTIVDNSEQAEMSVTYKSFENA